MVISSYLAVIEEPLSDEVLRQLASYPGVEVHGSEFGQYVVSIEAASVDDTYDLAVKLTKMAGISTFNLVYCNFEDETLGGQS